VSLNLTGKEPSFRALLVSSMTEVSTGIMCVQIILCTHNLHTNPQNNKKQGRIKRNKNQLNKQIKQFS